MIVALHRPNGIALLAECLTGICSYSGIYQYRRLVEPYRASACIIMIMAFVIVSAFGCKKQTVLGGEVAKFRFWIPSKRLIDVLRSSLFQLIVNLQRSQGAENIHSAPRCRTFLVHQCRKAFQFIAVHSFSKTINKVRVSSSLC